MACSAAQHAVPLLQHCLSSFESEFALCAAASNAACADIPQPSGPGAGEPVATHEELVDSVLVLLPSFSQCTAAAAAGAAELELRAYALAHAQMTPEHPEYHRVRASRESTPANALYHARTLCESSPALCEHLACCQHLWA